MGLAPSVPIEASRTHCKSRSSSYVRLFWYSPCRITVRRCVSNPSLISFSNVPTLANNDSETRLDIDQVNKDIPPVLFPSLIVAGGKASFRTIAVNNAAICLPKSRTAPS